MIDPIIYTTKPPMEQVPGGWAPERGIIINGTNNPIIHKIVGVPGNVTYIDNFLSIEDCDKIIEFMRDAPRMEPVSVQGGKDVTDYRIGSIRTTMWNTIIAEGLWKLFEKYNAIGNKHCDENTLTDWWQDGFKPDWMPVAVSPMLRYMKYNLGGQHYAHYDAAYIYPDSQYRSLMSIVLYLTDNETGCTRFVADGKTGHVSTRNHDDWDREVKPEEVLLSVNPKKGRILLFDHRMCHDVSMYNGAEGERIIIRGDLIYKAI